MNRWRDLWLNLRMEIWQPANVLRLVTLLIVALVVLQTLVAPMRSVTRLQFISAAVASLVYAFIVWTPYLPRHKSFVDAFPLIVSGTSAIFFGLLVYQFYDLTPMVATLHFITIVGMAIRRGLWLALWAALLATISYLTVFFALGAPAHHVNDSIVIVVSFLVIALLIGSLGQALHRRTRELENVVNHSREAILILNEHGRFEYANPAALHLGGYALEQLQRRSLFDLIIPADQANTRQAWEALRAGTESNEVFVVRILVQSGEQRTLAVTLAKFDAHPARYVIIARDITLQESEQQAHERRHRELDAERVVAQAISQIHNRQELLTIALAEALQAIQADTGAIYLADEAQTTLTIAVTQNVPADLAALALTRTFGKGITGAAAAERRIITVPNLNRDPRVQIGAITQVMFAQVSVPLIYQERVLGVLTINSHSERDYSDEDLGLLRAIASSIAVALDRARLFETLEQRVIDRTAELAALNQVAAAANQSLDLDRVLKATLDELMQTAHAQGAWLSLFNPEQGTLRMRAQQGVPASVLNDPTILHIGEGISGLVIQTGQARALNIVDSDIPTRDRLLAEGMQSICAVPLTLQGRTVGVLGLLSHQRDRFGETELVWLGAIGNTVAVALNNAQLFESVERKANQLATLREIDHTLNAVLELPAMLETALTSIARIVPHDRANVLLLHGDKLRAVAGRGIPPAAFQQYAFSISNHPLFQTLAQTHQPIILEDVTQSRAWITMPGMESIRSWLGVPLIAREKIIGQISLYGEPIGAFTPEHGQVLLAFANHAAIAIANAQLRAELNKTARHDSLTQTLNHGTLIEELRQAATRGESLTMIMLDLDNFKRYNDTYGHIVGDQVLNAAVRAIRAHVKKTDLVGRWGGEEFGIVLPGANTERGRLVAERIRQTLSATLIYDTRGAIIPPPTASQGIATLGVTASTIDELIDHADRALYRAKARGKDQVVVAE